MQFVNFTINGLAGKVEETCGVEISSSGGLAEEPFQHAGQSLDCSQVENEPQERDSMDRLMVETNNKSQRRKSHEWRKCTVHQNFW